MVAPISSLASLGASLTLRIGQIIIAIIVMALSAYTLYSPLFLDYYYTAQALGVACGVMSLIEGALLLGLFKFFPPIFALVCEVVMSVLCIATFGYFTDSWYGTDGYIEDGDPDSITYWYAWPYIQAAWALSFILFLIHVTMMILIVVYIMVPWQGSPKLGKIRTMAIGSIFPAKGMVNPYQSTAQNEYPLTELYHDKEAQVGEQTVPMLQPQQQVPTGNYQISQPPAVMGKSQPPSYS